jgi:hypothetical protein
MAGAYGQPRLDLRSAETGGLVNASDMLPLRSVDQRGKSAGAGATTGVASSRDRSSDIGDKWSEYPQLRSWLDHR